MSRSASQPPTSVRTRRLITRRRLSAAKNSKHSLTSLVASRHLAAADTAFEVDYELETYNPTAAASMEAKLSTVADSSTADATSFVASFQTAFGTNLATAKAGAGAGKYLLVLYVDTLRWEKQKVNTLIVWWRWRPDGLGVEKCY